MAVVTVYPRHSKKCQHAKGKGTRASTNGATAQSGYGGARTERSHAKTRSWEVANRAARKLEEELELKAMGLEPTKKADHISIESAVDLYLKDMKQRGIRDPSKARRMLGRLREYANAKNVILLKDVSARLLMEWRNGWAFQDKQR